MKRSKYLAVWRKNRKILIDFQIKSYLPQFSSAVCSWIAFIPNSENFPFPQLRFSKCFFFFSFFFHQIHRQFFVGTSLWVLFFRYPRVEALISPFPWYFMFFLISLLNCFHNPLWRCLNQDTPKAKGQVHVVCIQSRKLVHFSDTNENCGWKETTSNSLRIEVVAKKICCEATESRKSILFFQFLTLLPNLFYHVMDNLP